MAKKPREPEDPHINAMPFGIFMVVFSLVGFYNMWEGTRGYLRTDDEVKATAQVTSYKRHGRSPTLDYEYTWKGQHFRGWRIGLLGYWAGADTMLVNAYESGKPIEVFIDPSHPSYSVVDRSWRWDRSFYHSLWAIGFGAGAVYNFYLVARRKKRPPDDSRQIRRAAEQRKRKKSRRGKR